MNVSKLVTIVPRTPIHTLYLQHIIRQTRGISGLAGNVGNAGVPPPPKGKVSSSNLEGRTIKLLFYIDFILEAFLP